MLLSKAYLALRQPQHSDFPAVHAYDKRSEISFNQKPATALRLLHYSLTAAQHSRAHLPALTTSRADRLVSAGFIRIAEAIALTLSSCNVYIIGARAYHKIVVLRRQGADAAHGGSSGEAAGQGAVAAVATGNTRQSRH